MKIASWNVNSVRARIYNILKYLKRSSPDILMMQEIKTEEKNFPFEDIKKAGYNSYVLGQKSYNGVAFISRDKINEINTNFFIDEKKQSRVITADIKSKNSKIKLINVYIPNGNPIDTDKYTYKKNWLNSFIKEVNKTLKKNKNIIISGDFNVIPEEMDCHDHLKYQNDALFKLEIRKKFRELLNLGFVDIYRHVNKHKQEYTFWDYTSGAWHKNNGMRIDHFLISNDIISILKRRDSKRIVFIHSAYSL